MVSELKEILRRKETYCATGGNSNLVNISNSSSSTMAKKRYLFKFNSRKHKYGF